MVDSTLKTSFRFWRWLILVIGVLVPRRLRTDWRQEWEAELRCHEELLAQWDKLNRQTKLGLLWHSLGAFMDALWMQPRRLEDEMMQDLRFGSRMLLKRKGFTTVAVLSLALGIGANTAIFSVVDSILLRPLPYPGAERLVKILATEIKQGQQWEGWNRAYAPLADFREWRSQSRSFEEMALQTGVTYQGGGTDEPGSVIGSRVSLNFFSFMGTQAALGRTFLPEDEKPESERVVVLSHAYWMSHYKGDPQVLGQKLVLGEYKGDPYAPDQKRVLVEQSYTIVGVLPASFRDYFKYNFWNNSERWAPLRVNTPTPIQVWLPISVTHEAATWYGRGGNRHGAYQVLARLKSGVALEQAQAEMSAIAARLAERYPESNHDRGAAVFSLHEEVTGGSRRKMLLLVAAFSLVLLIACANVASLLLARGIERAKELAIRATLGAHAGRVLRQMLTECLLLATLGGTVGLLLAVGMVAGIRPLLPADIPRSDAVTLDYRALLFTLGLTVLTTLLFGLLPAWQTAKLNLTEELKEAGRSVTESRRNRRWRHALVIGQVALTMILLTGAGLLTRSFWRIYRGELGYDTHNLVRLRVPLPGPVVPFSRESYMRISPNDEDAEQWRSYWQPLLEQVRSLPNVAGAALTTGYLPEGAHLPAHMRIPGHTPPDPRRGPIIHGDAVSLDYFSLLEIKLMQGRYFNADDRAEAPPVVIINESFARTYFPQQSPIGQSLTFNPGPKYESSATIVGVVADTRARLDRQIEPLYYRPIVQTPLRGFNLIVRTVGNPAASFDALRDVARSFNPYRAADKPITLDEVWVGFTIKPRFYLALLGSLALLALLLAATGIYGTLFLAVSQRSHEIGVRRALGAQDRDVLRLVLRQGMWLVLAGLTLGLLGAFALTRAIRGWLIEVSPTDPLTFAAVAVLFLLITLLACYAPARRAVQVDPLAALRHE